MSKPVISVHLAALLTDIADKLDNYVDVDDGSDGQPQANWAMSLVQRIEEELACHEVSHG